MNIAQFLGDGGDSEVQEEKNTLLLEIVTPYHHFYEGKIESIVLNSLDGDVGIFPGHEPVVVALTPGITHFQADGNVRYATLMEGFAEVGPYLVLVVCDAAEWPDQIDVKRVKSAYARAIKRYHDTTLGAQERTYARHSIRRAKMRLKLISDHGTEAQKTLLKE